MMAKSAATCSSSSYSSSNKPLLLPFTTILTIFFFFSANASSQTQQLQQQQQRINRFDLAALMAIKTSLSASGTNTNFFSTWDFTSLDPCSSFSGVICSSSSLRVTSLFLGTGFSGSQGLAGSLSPSLSLLSDLTQLVLYPGIVTGPIPPHLGALRNLRVLSLTGNRLTGPIPTTFNFLYNLHTLDLSGNRLTGPIPPSLLLNYLPQLKVLILASNLLSGELVPVSTQLLHLDLTNNRIQGRLPPSMPSSLRYLSVSGNAMWGPLNGSLFESLSELVYLDLSMNRFSGPLPLSLFHSMLFLSLSSVFLQRNNFIGGLPLPPPTTTSGSLYRYYGAGTTVDLSHNFLTGEISSVLAGAENLFLNNNRFMGSVPREYADSVYSGAMKTLYLQHNYLTEFPVEPGAVFPDSVALCLSYNCMVPPVAQGLVNTCPASSGGQLSRPESQCSVSGKQKTTQQ